MGEGFPTSDQSWQWDEIFSGGVESTAFREEVESLKREARSVREEIEAMVFPPVDEVGESFLEAFDAWVEQFFEVSARHREARSFAMGMAATHTDRPEAMRLPSMLDEVALQLDQAEVMLQTRFRKVEQGWIEGLLRDARFEGRRLWVKEVKRDGDQAMEEALELLAVELNQDGIETWARTYREVMGRVKVEVEGREEPLSVGQARNLLSHRDREVRRAAQEGLKVALDDVAPICATALNAIRGTQRTLFEQRGGDYLTEPLQKNRVRRRSLEAMMEGVKKMRPVLHDFLEAKSDYHGWGGLEWYDRSAPAGEIAEEISYEEGQRFIVDQVDGFSPKIAAYCRRALGGRWVEAEDRAGKRQGGYCTTLPVANQIRIFMTYSNTPSSVTTLAHELGHGYHAEVIKGLPHWQRRITMGLAESASTLVEAIVEEGALEAADRQGELALLDRRLMRGVTFLINIPARFEFDVATYERREEGSLDEDWLKQESSEVLKRHYGEVFNTVDPLQWVSTAHYYMNHMPFYNFPYTFGYLFSRAVLKKARGLGPEATPWLDDLLRDTGRLSSEEVADKHLDADLEDPQFWYKSAINIADDLSRYKALVSGTPT